MHVRGNLAGTACPPVRRVRPRGAAQEKTPRCVRRHRFTVGAAFVRSQAWRVLAAAQVEISGIAHYLRGKEQNSV
jgi:hypothetical protein